MVMPFWLKAGSAGFGFLFFVGCLLLGCAGFRSAPTRDGRLEAVGAVIPGLGGLLIVAASLSSNRFWGLIAALAAIPVMVLGRATYEVIVFRPR